MRGAFWVPATLGLAVSGCEGRLVLTAPEGTELYAWVVLDAEEGRLTGSTPLRPTSEKLELELPLGHRAFLLAYGAGAEARIGAPAIGPEPLRRAEGCAARLPDADEVHALRGDVLERVEPDDLPPLTAPWLGARCDAADLDDLLVDVQCVGDPCPAAAARSGCAVAVQGPACGLEAFELGLDPSAPACAETGPCAVRSGSADALVTLSCRRPNFDEACSVQLFRRAPFPPVELERVQVLDVEPVYPEAARYAPYVIRGGYLSDLVFTEDLVLVTSLEGTSGGVGACRGRGAHHRLHVFSREDLSRQGELVLPRCAWGLHETAPGRFVGFTVDGSTDHVLSLSFSLLGGEVRTATIAAVDFENAIVTSALHLGPGRSVVAVVSPLRGQGLLVFVDDEGRRLSSARFSDVEFSGLERYREGFVATESWGDSFVYFDEEGAILGTVPVPERASRSLGAPKVHAPSNHVTVPIARDVRQVASMTPGLELHPKRLLHYELAAAPTAIADWPPEPRLQVAGVTVDGPEPLSYLARLDPVAGHFLPGVLEVGPGPAAVMRTDPEGRVYVLLSWAAQLVRVTSP